jgi:hypothetical protein
MHKSGHSCRFTNQSGKSEGVGSLDGHLAGPYYYYQNAQAFLDGLEQGVVQGQRMGSPRFHVHIVVEPDGTCTLKQRVGRELLALVDPGDSPLVSIQDAVALALSMPQVSSKHGHYRGLVVTVEEKGF